MTPQRFTFNRLELAGSLGDLGTLLPLAIGMVLINGLNPVGLFFAVGLYYIVAGLYFGVTVPVQPMKVIGAYAIATGLPSSQIIASGFTIAAVLLVIGGTRAVDVLGRYTPRSVVRGVQLSTGALLMAQGVKLIVGTSRFQALQQAAEPYLAVQHIGPLPIGIVVGCLGLLLTLLLLDNKKLPAGLVVVLCGIALGAVIGTHQGFERLRFGLHLPRLMPFAFPSAEDFSLAILILVLPQVPMTLGNAVIAYADLSREYFGENSRLVSYRSACISMALANVISSLLGGMPLCHGAGGLAAHYRFGARSAGSNLIIGAVFVLLVLLLGERILAVLYLVPLSILGVLLVFAGGQLAMTILDMMSRKELFVILLMLGITLGSNLAAGFIAGLIIANLLKSKKLSV
jgi:SulP family sulfate permease